MTEQEFIQLSIERQKALKQSGQAMICRIIKDTLMMGFRTPEGRQELAEHQADVLWHWIQHIVWMKETGRAEEAHTWAVGDIHHVECFVSLIPVEERGTEPFGRIRMLLGDLKGIAGQLEVVRRGNGPV